MTLICIKMCKLYILFFVSDCQCVLGSCIAYKLQVLASSGSCCFCRNVPSHMGLYPLLVQAARILTISYENFYEKGRFVTCLVLRDFQVIHLQSYFCSANICNMTKGSMN